MKKTLKFGGQSLGSAEAMRNVASIIKSEQAQITVLSAMSGTYDALTAIIADDLMRIRSLEKKYTQCIEELLVESKEDAMRALRDCFEVIRSSKNPNKIIAQGDILTSIIFTLYAKEQGLHVELLYAPDFIHIDSNGEITVDKLMLRQEAFYVTQGFICSNEKGEISNLGPAGADLTATLVARAVESEEVQIWADDKVMRTGDPTMVDCSEPVEYMSFSQAAELAYFGAKILHPSIILPCREAGIDVVLKNSADPNFRGTRITTEENDIKFLAANHKDNITLIRITSDKMLSAYGFLRRVLGVFEDHHTSVDMVTTSEVAVSITIDDLHAISEIEKELQKFGLVEVEHNNTIVCIVGNMDYTNEGMAAVVFDTVSRIPVKMICYGASQRSLSLLVESEHAQPMLQRINTLF